MSVTISVTAALIGPWSLTAAIGSDQPDETFDWPPPFLLTNHANVATGASMYKMHRKYQQQDTLNELYRRREAIDCDGGKGAAELPLLIAPVFLGAEEDETNGHCGRDLSLSLGSFYLLTETWQRNIFALGPVLGQSEHGDPLSPRVT